jgi:hypothetical protein
VFLSSPGRSSRRTRRHLGLVFAFALLFAQAGALLHASSHAAGQRDTSGLHTQLCGQCLSYSTLFAFASGGPSVAVPPALYALGVASSLAVPLIQQRPSPAFRARAPPLPR